MHKIRVKQYEADLNLDISINASADDLGKMIRELMLSTPVEALDGITADLTISVADLVIRNDNLASGSRASITSNLEDANQPWMVQILSLRVLIQRQIILISL